MSAVEFENVTYSYESAGCEKKKALSNVSLKIEKGDYVCVIGHTGSGKTTFLKHIGAILKPTSGRVFVNEVDVSKKGVDLKKVNRDIGFVFQNPSYQLFEETVEKDIAFGPKNFGFDEDEVLNLVKRFSKMVGLGEDVLKKSPFELSGGQKRRVAIAGVFATNPKILLLDEPTSGLDPIGKRKILEIIKQHNKKFKSTVIVVTHSMEDIYLYANKILVLNKGEIFSYGGVEETFSMVDELQKIGLDVPDISKVFLKLKEMGFSVPVNIYSVEKAVEYIKNIILKRKRKC